MNVSQNGLVETFGICLILLPKAQGILKKWLSMG
jgi:hypothetical protein